MASWLFERAVTAAVKAHSPINQTAHERQKRQRTTHDDDVQQQLVKRLDRDSAEALRSSVMRASYSMRLSSVSACASVAPGNTMATKTPERLM